MKILGEIFTRNAILYPDKLNPKFYRTTLGGEKFEDK